MTIICTIHQPSSELFQIFDRAIVLSRGYTIYNGEVKNITPYFSNLGIEFPRFSNPADYLLKIAS